jgi:hypothetical protein
MVIVMTTATTAETLSSAAPSKEKVMQLSAPALAHPLHTEQLAWVPTGPGKSFRPLRFEPDGWSELMRLEPGSLVGWHLHTGDVHAFNLIGTRQILSTGETVGPGDYVYEPAGNVDTWQAVGEQPCIVHIKVVGAVEYLDENGNVVGGADTASQQAAYLAWCQQHRTEPAVAVIDGESDGDSRPLAQSGALR